ncbi:hypothetical protein ESCOMM167M_23900 [Escherichia coli]
MLKTSPQARKQWEGLPDELTVRLISRKVNGHDPNPFNKPFGRVCTVQGVKELPVDPLEPQQVWWRQA